MPFPAEIRMLHSIRDHPEDCLRLGNTGEGILCVKVVSGTQRKREDEVRHLAERSVWYHRGTLEEWLRKLRYGRLGSGRKGTCGILQRKGGDVRPQGILAKFAGILVGQGT